MLIPRIITGLILISIVAGSVLFLSPLYFSIALAVVVLLGAWEWYDLNGKGKSFIWRITYVALTAAILYASTIMHPKLAFELLKFTILWWALACLLVLTYPKTSFLWQSQWIRLLAGWLVLIPTWYALSFLRAQNDGDELILYIVMIVGATDVGAFFSGRTFGKHRLAPNVSPGKTWEGVIGGIITAQIMTLAITIFAWSLTPNQILGFSILALQLSVMSIFGDLFESMFKRARGIKDSGKILPGHGGVLDRIDSITAAAPIFVIFFPYMTSLSIL